MDKKNMDAKKGIFKKLVDKLDRKLEEKSEKECCCSGKCSKE